MSLVGYYRFPALRSDGAVFEVFARDGKTFARSHPQAWEFEVRGEDWAGYTRWPAEDDVVRMDYGDGPVGVVEAIGEDECAVRSDSKLYNCGVASLRPEAFCSN